jgi:hypothetical protein
MAKLGNLVMSGKSGEKYRFQTWPFRTRFRSSGAVFVVSKRLFNDKNYQRASHQIFFIGQTSDMSEPMGPDSRLDVFEKNGANCVCVYPSADEEERMNIVEDLIASNHPSLQQ